MYMNTGYLKHSHMDFKDKSRPLIVGSCGIYRLSEHPKMPTYRPRGRVDFQIIYIAAGCGHFHFDTVDNEKSFRNMNTMGKIRQKSTGFILLEVM